MAIKINTHSTIIGVPAEFLTEINFIDKTVTPNTENSLEEYKIDNTTMWLKPTAISAVTFTPIAVDTDPGIYDDLKPSLKTAAKATSIDSLPADYAAKLKWESVHTEVPTSTLHCYGSNTDSTYYTNILSYNLYNDNLYKVSATQAGSCNALDMGNVNRCSVEQWSSYPHTLFTQRNYGRNKRVGESSYDLSPRYACNGDTVSYFGSALTAWHIANPSPYFIFDDRRWTSGRLGTVAAWPSMPYVFIKSKWTKDSSGNVTVELILENNRYHFIGMEFSYFKGGSSSSLVDSGKEYSCGWSRISSIKVSLGKYGVQRDSSAQSALEQYKFRFGKIKLYAYDASNLNKTYACTFWTKTNDLPWYNYNLDTSAYNNYRGLSDSNNPDATVALTILAPYKMNLPSFVGTVDGPMLYLGNNSNAAETGRES